MFRSGRFLWNRQLESVPKGLRFCSTAEHNSSGLGINIPPRIERGPTDILKALASTVGRDPTSFHYKYPDDPYFYPYANSRKRTLALSLESGKKSARWIIEKNPAFFQHKVAQPEIMAFTPKPVFDENSEVSEETLIAAIKERSVATAMSLYDILKKKEVSLSNATKQILLELVCFYTGEEKQFEENLEEKWFIVGLSSKTITWKHEGFATALYESMDPDCPLAFSAFISGMLKHNQVGKAVELLSKRNKNMNLAVSVYNELIKNVHTIMVSSEKRWQYIFDLLKEMNRKSIQPNLGTLNAVLFSLSNIATWIPSERIAWEVLEEFKNLGIPPSLGTYCFLICLACDKREVPKQATELVCTIIRNLQKVEFEIRHPSDMLFFVTVMRKCCWPLKSSALAHDLNALLWEKDNVKFLGGNQQENIYYRNYLSLVFSEDPIESAMQTFRRYVPTVYTPENSLYKEILKRVDLDAAVEFLPEIYKNMKEHRLADNFESLCSLLRIVRAFGTNDPLPEFYREIGITAWKKVTEESLWSVEMPKDLLSNLIVALVKTGEGDKALSLFQKAGNPREELSLMEVQISSLELLFGYLTSQNKIPEALECLKYAVAREYGSVTSMAEAVLPLLADANSKDFKWVEALAKEQEGKASS